MNGLPRKIEIIKEPTEEYFRLRYYMGSIRVTSKGFSTKEEFIEMIKSDEYFKIPDISKQSD